jgi:hypothetical protein
MEPITTGAIAAVAGAAAAKPEKKEKGEKEGLVASLIKPLLVPSAELAGNELRLVIKEGIDRFKEGKRRENIRRYFELLAAESAKDPDLKAKAERMNNPTIEMADALTEAMEGAQDVEPESELGAIWQELLRRVTSGVEDQRSLIGKLKQLSEREVRTLLWWRGSGCKILLWRYWRGARMPAAVAEGCLGLEQKGVMYKSYSPTIRSILILIVSILYWLSPWGPRDQYKSAVFQFNDMVSFKASLLPVDFRKVDDGFIDQRVAFGGLTAAKTAERAVSIVEEDFDLIRRGFISSERLGLYLRERGESFQQRLYKIKEEAHRLQWYLLSWIPQNTASTIAGTTFVGVILPTVCGIILLFATQHFQIYRWRLMPIGKRLLECAPAAPPLGK